MSTMAQNAAGPAGGAIREVDAATVNGWLGSGQAVLVDVREPDEHARERIPGAVLMPLSGFDAGKLAALGARRIVFHCRAGQRSLQACRAAVAGAPAGVEVLSLKGGIQGWKGAGLAVQAGAGPRMSVLRQTQLAIGAGVLVGTGVGYFVHPLGFALAAFFGAGLIFAGATGTCGLAMVMAKMPWNRIEVTDGGCAGGKGG